MYLLCNSARPCKMHSRLSAIGQLNYKCCAKSTTHLYMCIDIAAKLLFRFWKIQQETLIVQYSLRGFAWLRGLMHQLSAGGLNLPDKWVDPDCWPSSGFESPRWGLVVSLFQDPISYGRFTGATLYVPCLDWGLMNYILFFLPRSFKNDTVHQNCGTLFLNSKRT